MNKDKILASLSYFSIFFAPFLLPLIIYFVSDNFYVKGHAKKALLSHLVPFLGIIMIITGIIGDFANGGLPVFFIIGIIVYGLLSFIVLIWNIVKGIRLLMN
ncbi:DUF4870 domain-containing protein [Peribacillus kribbensis]|uniref:DUF4870 domain-containing protein n=1 Tax=Peribacillus kribbensis TaxID=356658 RepID=UPI0004024380|nr:DUF4870 domain-containing protein [Peribacillus kribbensis]